ncbi:hypothetical protein GCM10022291_10000 [Postechiella marina]|uniref:Uncharacterized protein n=1 Tax=Postechiella marina TaxID=943941 RepID=A0ABP8C4E7_9FLAO
MKTKFTILITALLLVCQVNAQNTLTVDNSAGANAQYNNLQTAISVATAGDIIYVHPSETSYGNISINKSITIIGFGHLNPEKRTEVEDIILGDGASNTKISGFYINDDLIASNSALISNLVIENNYVKSYLGFDTSGGVDNVIVRGNIIAQMGTTNSATNYNNYTNTIISNNVFVHNYLGLKNYQSITVKNNIFIKASYNTPIYNAGVGDITVQNNIVIYDSASNEDPNSSGVVFENCMIYNFGSGNVALPTGTNNLYNQDPLFVSTDNPGYGFYAEIDDYHLQAGSSAKGTGAGGVDMGLYDGTGVFNNYGYTKGVPSVKITNITDRIAPGANLSVDITSKAN